MFYRRNGGAPVPLPYSEQDPASGEWIVLAGLSEAALAVLGWKPGPNPPEVPAGEQLVWDPEAEAWLTAPIEATRYVDKITFRRLLTFPQWAAIEAVRLLTQGLVIEDFGPGATIDRQMLIAARYAFQTYDDSGEINLLDQDVAEYLDLMANAFGVFGPDPTVAAAEIARIISNTPPAP